MVGLSSIFQSGGSLKSLGISQISRISREWTFPKRPLFQKTPFSKPEVILPKTEKICMYWEVLNGVGVDGVGVIFPFFYAFSPFSTHFPPFSTQGQGQTPAIYCKNGEFHSDPVCTDPVQNFPNSSKNRKDQHVMTSVRMVCAFSALN